MGCISERKHAFNLRVSVGLFLQGALITCGRDNVSIAYGLEPNQNHLEISSGKILLVLVVPDGGPVAVDSDGSAHYYVIREREITACADPFVNSCTEPGLQ